MKPRHGGNIWLCCDTVRGEKKDNVTEPSNSERVAGFGTPAPPWGHVGNDLPDQSDTVKPAEYVSPESPTKTPKYALGRHIVLSTKLLHVKVKDASFLGNDSLLMGDVHHIMPLGLSALIKQYVMFP